MWMSSLWCFLIIIYTLKLKHCLFDCYLFYYYLDMIDVTSQSMLKLSDLGKTIKNITVISDSTWPSWLYTLDLFSESSMELQKIRVLVHHLEHSNMFGTNRLSSVSWHKCDVLSVMTMLDQRKLASSLHSSDLILFSGSLPGLKSLVALLKVSPPSTPNVPKLVFLVPGKCRFRQLSCFTDLHWKRLRHAECGGATTATAWLGSSNPFRNDLFQPPTYCPHVMADLIEFTPKHCSIVSVPPVDGSSLIRAKTVLAHESIPHTWWCNGLFPAQMFIDTDNIPRIVTATPFVASGWGHRPITGRELARFCDVPVNVEKHFHKAYPTVLPSDHPLRTSFSSKLLSHALWDTGLCSLSGGGCVDLTRTKFTIDSVSGHLISQDQFNLAVASVDEKAVKMDDAKVPVMLWDHKLIRDYPKPEVLKKTSTAIISWSLNVIRKFLLTVWFTRIYKSLTRYLKLEWPEEYEAQINGNTSKIYLLNKEYMADVDAGTDCLYYATLCSWWEWLGGSRLFFWRWTKEFKTYARDGILICWLPN